MNPSSPEPDAVARESIIFARLQVWDKAITSGPEIGIMCREVRDTPLWPYRTDPETAKPCTSWTRWMHVAAPRAASTAFGYLKQVEALSDIPDGTLARIRGENVDTVMHLSTAVRAEPEVLEAAKTQKADEFVEHIQKTHPDQHIEHRKTMKFRPAESAAKVIENVLEEAMEHGASNRDDALELAMQTAHEAWQMESQLDARVSAACDEVV
jgi:hypothetical protein